MKIIRRAKERGHANHGWLDSYHTFSFANYYDPAWMGFRSLRVINEDRVAPAQGFGTHPHRDMEIITYVLEGQLKHEDSMGNGRVIQPGEFQYFAAGTGVQHSEFNPSEEESTHFLQIWIQPDTQGAQPRYAERALASDPWQLVASKSGRDESIAINQDIDLWLAKLGAGESIGHRIASGRAIWMHVAEGEIIYKDHVLNSGDSLSLAHEDALDLESKKDSQALVFDLS